jgi:hypothetical protein
MHDTNNYGEQIVVHERCFMATKVVELKGKQARCYVNRFSSDDVELSNLGLSHSFLFEEIVQRSG